MINKIYLKSRTPDFMGSLIIFFIGYAVGMIYVEAIEPRQAGMFYPPTLVIDWSLGILNPYGLFFGASNAVAYNIFRLGMGYLPSLGCTGAFMVSSNHLYYLVPSIYRDYIKAPFVLCIILIIGLLVKSPVSRVRLFGLMVAGATVIYTGLLFRPDLVIFILPLILTVFFLEGPILKNIKSKIAIILLLLSFFALMSQKINSRHDGNASLNMVNGLMLPFNAKLGLANPAYDWGHQYLDSYTLADVYAHAMAGRMNHDYSYTVNEAARFAGDFILKIAFNFPADLLTRVYASTLKILELPFSHTGPPVGIDNATVDFLYSIRAKILNLFAGAGLFFCAAALLIIGVKSLRLAIFLLFFLVFLTGYPALQFQGRHYFHLEILSLWSLGFVIQHAASFSRKLIRHKSLRLPELLPAAVAINAWPALIKRLLSVSLVSLVLLVLPFFLFRWYQSSRAGELFRKYENSKRELLPVGGIRIDNRNILVTNNKFLEPLSPNSFFVDYLVANFDGRNCNYSNVWSTLYYIADPFTGRVDFSRTVGVSLDKSGVKRLFFPALSYNFGPNIGLTGSVQFIGIKMSQEQANCLSGIYRIADLSELPLLLTVVLPPPADDNVFYQRLPLFNRYNIYSVPHNISDAKAKKILAHSLLTLGKEDIIFQADNVHLSDGQIIIKGYASPQGDPFGNPRKDRYLSSVADSLFADVSIAGIDTDLLKTRDIQLKKGDYFVAQGYLYVGGLTLGLVGNNQNAGYVNIAERGEFRVVIEAPADGLYSVGLANNLDGYSLLENRITITKIGWIKADETHQSETMRPGR